MKKLVFTALLGMMSLSSMNATETRLVDDEKSSVMGYELEKDISVTWQDAINMRDKGAKTCLIMLLNDATICTYYAEPLETAKKLWASGSLKPICQGFNYDKDSAWIYAYDPYVGTLANHEEGYLFTYHQRIKIDGVKYDQVRVGTTPIDNDTKKPVCTYFLDKFK